MQHRNNPCLLRTTLHISKSKNRWADGSPLCYSVRTHAHTSLYPLSTQPYILSPSRKRMDNPPNSYNARRETVGKNQGQSIKTDVLTARTVYLTATRRIHDDYTVKPGKSWPFGDPLSTAKNTTNASAVPKIVRSNSRFLPNALPVVSYIPTTSNVCNGSLKTVAEVSATDYPLFLFVRSFSQRCPPEIQVPTRERISRAT